MNEQVRQGIDALLERHAEKVERQGREEQARLLSVAEARSRFRTLREGVLRPALQEIRARMIRAGHRVAVVEINGETDARTRKAQGYAIRLEVLPSGTSPLHRLESAGAFLTFSLDEAAAAVRVAGNTSLPGTAGSPTPEHLYPFQELGEDAVGACVLEFLGLVLAREA